MTEGEIIKGCIKNDRRCQNELYKKYFGMMSGVALRYYGSEDEAMQGMNYGFLKVLDSLDHFNNKYALATWIRNILVHHFIDDLRKNRKYNTTEFATEDIPSNQNTSINLAEYHFSEMALRDMLNQLPDTTRTVFNLFAIEGYKHTEIADMMNISEGTSKWHVSDARKKLGAMLKKEQRLEKKMIGTSNE